MRVLVLSLPWTIFLDDLSRAGQHRMAERVQAVLVGADLLALLVLDAFADHHHAVFVGLDRLFDLGQDGVHVVLDFGHQDDMGRVGRVAALGQHRAGGDPARRAAHHLDDAAGAVVGGHAAHVHADFRDGGGVVLDDRAVAGAVVRVGQVVVNGLGHADDAQRVVALDGLLVDLVRGVLRVVAADVSEVADVVGLEDLEQPVHVLGRLLRLLLEIDLVAAGAQRGGGRVFQARRWSGPSRR